MQAWKGLREIWIWNAWSTNWNYEDNNILDEKKLLNCALNLKGLHYATNIDGSMSKLSANTRDYVNVAFEVEKMFLYGLRIQITKPMIM